MLKTFTAQTLGLETQLVTVEIESTRGLPTLIFIGLPSRAVEEARDRVSAALSAIGLELKHKRTVVNLAPADQHKSGSQFELAIAVGLLQQLTGFALNTTDTLFLGELSLDGSLLPIRGTLTLTLGAQKLGFKRVVVPSDNVSEAALVEGIAVVGLKHLKQLMVWNQWPPATADRPMASALSTSDGKAFAAVVGQDEVKRALTVAAAGGHNVLLIGPPGAGKSLLSQALLSLLPPLSFSEMVEVTQIHSLHQPLSSGMVSSRPFRAPHHSISLPGLVGGGATIRPGELSLAHRGILFLDELPEFSRHTLESMRQPLETGEVSIRRVSGNVRLPAQCTLIAAANPCPCGFASHPHRRCQCRGQELKKYKSKLSGPLLDRIAMTVFVQPVTVTALESPLSEVEISRDGRRFAAAISQVHQRNLESGQTTPDARLDSTVLRTKLPLKPAAKQLLLDAIERYHLSARSYFHLLRLSKTIASLDQVETIDALHVAEALVYRTNQW